MKINKRQAEILREFIREMMDFRLKSYEIDTCIDNFVYAFNENKKN